MKLTSNRNQCPSCGEYFNRTSSFDRHRTGAFGTGIDGTSPERRCLTINEMQAKGFRKSAHGFWTFSKDGSTYPHGLHQR